jgi:hypothetical protein
MGYVSHLARCYYSYISSLAPDIFNKIKTELDIESIESLYINADTHHMYLSEKCEKRLVPRIIAINKEIENNIQKSLQENSS